MARLARCLLLPLAVVASGCHIEDRTPTGSRHDEAAIQAVLTGYHRVLATRDWARIGALEWHGATYATVARLGSPGPDSRIEPLDSALTALARRVDSARPQQYDVRVIRTDLRQEGNLAAAWVTTRRRLPAAAGASDAEWLELFVLRRVGDAWRILSVARANRQSAGSR